MIADRIKKYLEDNKVHYEIIVHPEAFTSQEVAEAEHVSGKSIAKVVVVKEGKQYAMVVVPAHLKVHLGKVAQAIGKSAVQFAHESEFEALFPDCLKGAMPPLGRLYDLPVLVDENLFKNEFIYFNAGDHVDSVKISTNDFKRIQPSTPGDYVI